MIKICGITDASFARSAEEAGADYLGFVFDPASPRFVTPAQVHRFVGGLAGRAKTVGVFTDPNIEKILSAAQEARPDVIQLHGVFAASDVKTLHMAGYEVWILDSVSAVRTSADAVLVDGHVGGRTGGTGQTADWARVRTLTDAGRRVVLAGGLGLSNLTAALATGCDVVDVNSSLETAPGVKDLSRLRALMRVYRTAVGQIEKDR